MSLNDYFDNIYCINLPQSVDRKEKMDEIFEKHDTKPIYVPAISPLDDEFKRVNNKISHDPKKRCYCLKDCKHICRPLRQTEIAISLSHLKTYRTMLENDDRIAMVIEDDVVFVKTVHKILGYLIDKGLLDKLRTRDPVIIFCGAKDNPGLSIENKREYRMIHAKSGYYSNYCYILNSAAAKVLIDNFFPITRPEDSYKRYLIGSAKIKSYRITPSLVGELSAGVNMKAQFTRFSTNISRDRLKSIFNKVKRNQNRRIRNSDSNESIPRVKRNFYQRNQSKQ
jgi:GR25 family glycosyltransferase involved in LPS biosynthesis